MANVLVNPSELTREICQMYLAGNSCEQIAEQFPDLPMGTFDVYGALFWLDEVVETERQVRPDEWETIE